VSIISQVAAWLFVLVWRKTMYSFTRKTSSVVPASKVVRAVERQKDAPNQTSAKRVVGDMEILERILTFGATGTYYVEAEAHLAQSVNWLNEAKSRYGSDVLRFIADFSDAGRASTNDHAIMALVALYPSSEDPDEYRNEYRNAFFRVIRIPTHLFLWVRYNRELRSFGRFARTLVQEWYNKQKAYSLLKYQGRYKWTHKDVWAVSHPKLTGEAKKFANWVYGQDGELPEIVEVYKEMLAAQSAKKVAALVAKHKLTHEFVPTTWHKETEVWAALLPNLPLMALLRNLNKLAAYNVSEQDVVARVDKALSPENIKLSRLHPLNILTTLVTYQNGSGALGSMTWKPSLGVLSVLDRAFEDSFRLSAPVGKKILVAVDVSASMTAPIGRSHVISSAQAALALAMLFKRREQDAVLMAYSDTLVPLPITEKTDLGEAMKIARSIAFGSTDCALPFAYARKNKLEFDCFISITDNETNTYAWLRGQKNSSPAWELDMYRSEVNGHAKSIVFATANSHFTIHRIDDMLSLDIAGYDPGIGNVVDNFFRG
jgi:60 kDa SS-A/Ro ribonucleoprotein